MTRRRAGATLLAVSLFLFAFGVAVFADNGRHNGVDKSRGSEHRNDHDSDEAGTQAGNPNHVCDGDSGGHSDTGHGANQGGQYDNTCDDPSYDPVPGNGGGNGERTGQPCTGCVGQADDKNPKGQMPNADDDGNNGYECDGNNGIGKGNPAHTGCAGQTTGGNPPSGTTTPPGGTGTPTPPARVLGEPTVKPAVVLGEQITRPLPTKVLGVQMARTGLDAIPLALMAVAMLGMGIVLMRSREFAGASK